MFLHQAHLIQHSNSECANGKKVPGINAAIQTLHGMPQRLFGQTMLTKTQSNDIPPERKSWPFIELQLERLH